LLADFDGKNPGLLLDDPGAHAVALDWTARGDPRPGGLHFDLELPASPIASLEVELPADRVLSVTSDGCVLSGPFDAEAADRKRWRVGFPRQSHLHLVVRASPETAGPGLLVVKHLETRQTLTPDSSESEYRLELEALPPGVRELRCELD